jgi:hypothetical protein
MRIFSDVAGASNLKTPVRPLSFRLARIASFIARKTETAMSIGGSPIPCKRKHDSQDVNE